MSGTLPQTCRPDATGATESHSKAGVGVVPLPSFLEPQKPLQRPDPDPDDWWKQILLDGYEENPVWAECAFEYGLITSKQYLGATRRAWLEELDETLTASVASTLNVEEALTVIRSREAA